MGKCLKNFNPTQFLFLLHFILLHLFFNEIFANEDCNTKHFYVENGNGVEGKLIEKFETSILDECIGRCAKNPKCNGANFLLNLNGDILCILHNTNMNGLGTETPAPETVMYSVRTYCQKETLFCSDAAWKFHKFSNYDVMNNSFVLQTFNNFEMDECLSKCQNNVACESVLYENSVKKCRFLSISLQFVHNPRNYFRYSKTVDLYESNCLKRPFDTSKCTFLKVNHGGFTDVFDARIESVSDGPTCEHVCLAWISGICRSYTYDSLTRYCYLSHLAHRTLGRNPLENLNSNYVTGELDDCLHFKLDCKRNSMSISGESLKMFAGALKTKKGRETMCEKQIDGSYKFTTDIEYEKCGIEKKMQPYPTYTGMLMVKEGSTDLITIKDKMIQLTCRMHHEIESTEHNLSYHFDVFDKNETFAMVDDKIQIHEYRRKPPSIGKPKYRLEVLDKNGNIAEIVQSGEVGYIVILEEQDSNILSKNFEVKELVAIDSQNGNQIELIDGNGCVVNGSMIMFMEKRKETQLKIKIHFSGFPNKTQVIYEALIKPCNFNCYKECNSEYYDFKITESENSTRKRRSLATDSRQFELSEDLYQIRSKERVHIFEEDSIPLKSLDSDSDDKLVDSSNVLHKIKPLKNALADEPFDEQISKERIHSTFSKCITEDITCIFTVILILLQLILLISCGFIIYVYMQHWINWMFQRRIEQELYNNNEIQYEFTNPNHNDDENVKT